MSAQLRIFDCQQQSLDWYMARAGIPTASEFHTVLSKGRKGEESQSRRTYMLKLAGEQITGKPMHSYTSEHMERGREMEDEARKLYVMMTESDPEQVGFLRRGDAGASPDSLVGDIGLLEIKTKLAHLQIDLLLANDVPNQHKAQCQGQMWIAEREWVDIFSYWPGLPPFIKRIFRDESYIARLKVEVDDFNSELQEIIARVRSYTVQA